MRRRSALIGFTEAELGFIVAAVVAFAAASEMPDAATAATVPKVVPPTAAPVVTTVADTGGAPARPVWVSDQHTRYCSSVKGANLKQSPLDVIRIESSTQYRLAGRSLSLEELNALWRPFEAEAVANQCRYVLRFDASENLSQKAALRAQRAVLGKFYIVNQ